MLLPRFERFKPHTDTDLVYLKSSPDYCEFDVKRGSLGTHGRECDHRSPGIDGCELMCCNRGYTTRKEKRVERCKCKFHWCCFVECEECVREVEVSVCNQNIANQETKTIPETKTHIRQTIFYQNIIQNTETISINLNIFLDMRFVKLCNST